MNFPSPLSPRLLLIAIGAIGTLGMTQDAPNQLPRPVQSRSVFVGDNGKANGVAPLSSNYWVGLSGMAGDKALGELAILTSSSTIQVSGPLDNSELPVTFSVSGQLEEKDGQFLFAYTLSFTVPLISTPPSDRPNNPNGPVPARKSIQYQQNTAQGTLRMTPGKKYEVLKVGGATYSLSVSPQADK